MRASQTGIFASSRPASRPGRTWIIMPLAVACLLLGPARAAWSVDHLNIDMVNDSALLWYTLEPVRAGSEDPTNKINLRPLVVLSPGVDDSIPALLVITSNPHGAPEAASLTVLHEFPGKQLSFLRLKYTVTDQLPYYDHKTGRQELVAVMFGHDTAWAVRVLPREGRAEATPLCGMPPRAEGDEETRLLVLRAEDYDYDGATEAFIYVYSPRPQDWRGLCCFNIEEGRVEWSLPVATPVLYRDFFSLQDSLHPGVIFLTRYQSIGNADTLFSDSVGQLAVVNGSGQVEFCRTVQRQITVSALCRGQRPGLFYLNHNCYEDCQAYFAAADSLVGRLSAIDRSGRILNSVKVPGRAYDMWLAPYDTGHTVALWRSEGRRGITVYDTSLTLLAASDSAEVGTSCSRLALAPFEDTVLFFMGEVLVQNGYRDLEQVAMPDLSNNWFTPVTYDKQGRISALALTNPNQWLIGRYRQRGLVELVTIFYVRYQTPMLMIVTGLVVSLVLVNFFRYRNKSTAHLIARQKHELEQTHQALKEAQATIVAQEKYRQARDIAGGFAHEIRNALFPAEAALHKLMHRRRPGAEDPEQTRRYLTTAESAVTRAIGVTELISSYTRLESEAAEEAVDLAVVLAEVIEANRLRAKELGVMLEAPSQAGWWIRSNPKQLFMVLNNLVVNSMDALTGRPAPRIVFSVGREADVLLLSVTDNGTGIAPEALPRVFDTFFSTKPNKGNGLGLAIAKRIVELYGGTIAVASQPGAWTRFDLRFRVTAPHP